MGAMKKRWEATMILVEMAEKEFGEKEAKNVFKYLESIPCTQYLPREEDLRDQLLYRKQKADEKQRKILEEQRKKEKDERNREIHRTAYWNL